MKKYLSIIFLFFSYLSYSQNKSVSLYGKLRIDVDDIINHSRYKKTYGECIGYLQYEIQEIKKKYSKESGEYIYLKKYYLDYLGINFNAQNDCNSYFNNEYINGREELFNLTKKIYGTRSVLYADAIGYYVMNFTNLCSNSLDKNKCSELLKLYDTGLEIYFENNSIDSNDLNISIPIYWGGKADLFYKIGKRDSALSYYSKAINYKLNHPIFDYYFPPLITLYASVLMESKTSSDEGLNILKKYAPLIKEKYINNPKPYFNYLCRLIDMAINSNQIGRGNSKYIKEAEEICIKEHGKNSSNYIDFVLNQKIQAYKNLGLKSAIFSLLAELDVEVFKKYPKSLTINNFRKYYWEWYKFYQSVNNEDEGIKYLYFVNNYEENNKLDLIRSEVIWKRAVLDEIRDYYYSRNIDSATTYLFKALDLEIKAKEKYGNYVIHEYYEIAKYYTGFNDFKYIQKGLKYCDLALQEFEKSYGINSDYYKAALYTKGKVHYFLYGGNQGLEEMYPEVYGNLYNTNYIPPYNTSVFQSYSNVLNSKMLFDSSDYFYSEIYNRNPEKDFFAILGLSQSTQIKSLNFMYNQNYHILSDHFERFKKYGYDSVSINLAENLFKKNLIFNLQKEEKDAIIDYSTSEDLKATIKKSKEIYDSLIFNNSKNKNLIDSIYSEWESNKSWVLENYKIKKSNFSENSKFKYDSVISHLEKDQCLLDIIRFKSDEMSDNKIHYATTIIDKFTKEKLKYIFLKDGELIEEYARLNNLNGLNILLSPLINELNKYSKIFINPDGAFNLINFYSLKEKGNKYLIETKTIQYVNSLEGVNSDNTANNKSKYHTAVFFGDPNFSNSNSISEYRSTLFDGYNFSTLKELPNTHVEISKAIEVLNPKGWGTKSFFRNNCSEKNFSQNTNYNIIHIATHGFYYDDTAVSISEDVFYNNPYLRSGLIFGLKEKSNKNNFDNILTAHEVFDYDLHNTSLVVLSACESAKGESNPGQGLYGIQRAFKIAGAKNVLVSTKKVNDKATKMLMSFFYSHVAKGEDYVNALRNAQLEMMHNPLIEDVNYWNGFLLIGE